MPGRVLLAVAAMVAVGLVGAGTARAAACVVVTLTGTQSGPPAFNGLAGFGDAGALRRRRNDCSDALLQFDAGRGTVMT